MLSQLFVNGLIAGSIYALVALGFSLIYATTRGRLFDRLEIRSLQPCKREGG